MSTIASYMASEAREKVGTAVSLKGQCPHRTPATTVLFSLVGVWGTLCLTGPSGPLASPISPLP